LKLTDLAGLDDASFRALFSKSPVKRIGRESFLRNVHYALGNHFRVSADAGVEAVLLRSLNDENAVVRGAAVWALKQGLSAEDFAGVRAEYTLSEADEDVQKEWQA
jgi:epoxyqueuosine reductase